MIKAPQIRAARLILWLDSKGELADKAGVSQSAVARMEQDEADPRVSTLEAVRKALENAGVEFLPATQEKGVGVRFRSDILP